MFVKSIQALFDVTGRGSRDVVFGLKVVGLLHAWCSFYGRNGSLYSA